LDIKDFQDEAKTITIITYFNNPEHGAITIQNMGLLNFDTG